MPCTEEQKEYARNYYYAHKEQMKAYKKQWEKENPDKINQYRARGRAKSRQYNIDKGNKWKKLNPDKVRISNQQWRSRNKDLISLYGRLRELNQQNAYPKWLTKEQKQEIKAFYNERDKRNILEGLEPRCKDAWTVDHMVPIQGDDVCGLHVPWNLQLMRNGLNSSKSNLIT